MSPSLLYVVVLLVLSFLGLVAVCYTLLRRGGSDDYINVAALIGLAVFVIIGIGGPFLYADAMGLRLADVGWMGLLGSFVGMIVGLLIAWVITRRGLRSQPAEPPASRSPGAGH
jgi:cellobiose-specific phosphotransferase system component IIC